MVPPELHHVVLLQTIPSSQVSIDCLLTFYGLFHCRVYASETGCYSFPFTDIWGRSLHPQPKTSCANVRFQSCRDLFSLFQFTDLSPYYPYNSHFTSLKRVSLALPPSSVTSSFVLGSRGKLLAHKPKHSSLVTRHKYQSIPLQYGKHGLARLLQKSRISRSDR